MRWLLISSQHHPTQGGIGAYVHRFVTAATNHGWHVELVTPPGLHPRANAIHEVVTDDTHEDFAHRIPTLRRIERIRPYRYGLWSLAVAQKLLQLPARFDAVEFVDCQAEGFVSLSSSAVRRRFHGVPMIVHAHTPMFLEEHINGADVNRFGRAIYHEWERRSLMLADGVITTSAGLRDRLRITQPTAIIPYIIEPEPSFASQSRTFEILFVGTMQRRKGVEDFIASMNAVFEANSNATASLIGPDTPSGSSAQSMIADAMLRIRPEYAERVKWLGRLGHEQVMPRIAQAAIVVVPSRFESFSFVAAEALCVGTPVIVSDQVGLAEHVPDVMTFPTGNVAALADAQLRVLNDRSAAERHGRGCRDKLLEVCAPTRNLALRQAFVDAIEARSASALTISEDSLSEMESFLDDVERAETEASTSVSSRAVL